MRKIESPKPKTIVCRSSTDNIKRRNENSVEMLRPYSGLKMGAIVCLNSIKRHETWTWKTIYLLRWNSIKESYEWTVERTQTYI